MRKPLLLTAANLHTGGGLAVAVSVLHELSLLSSQASALSVMCSSEVDTNLRAMGANCSAFAEYSVVDTYGAGAIQRSRSFEVDKYSAVLAVFGPLYWLRMPRVNVVGFAQPWIAYPHNDAYKLLPVGARIATRAKYELVAIAFARADCLIVEQEHVKSALRKRRMFRSKQIEVVPNVVDALHFDPSRWSQLDLPPKNADLRLGIVSRNYRHKNLEVVPDILQALKVEHGIEAEFWVTFSQDELSSASARLQDSVHSIGPLRSDQVPNFYRQLDGVVFPSLLECFSATPIEALAARVPLFASDRDFVRESVGENAMYFDPLDPTDIARTVAEFFTRDVSEQARWIETGHQFIITAPYSSRSRALDLLRVVESRIELLE